MKIAIQSTTPQLNISRARHFHSYFHRCQENFLLELFLPLKNAKLSLQDGSRRSNVAPAAQRDRWNLDDVERISRGRPSKAKLGSRAVPHRLNAVERKAFELAKKREYVVQQANSRRYPLINTYRNYCDALGLPFIRIDQGPADSMDEVVIDFTPLHQSEADVIILREEVSKAVESISALTEKPISDEDDLSSQEPRDESPVEALYDVSPPLESMLSSGFESNSKPLRFQACSRAEAKLLAQTAIHTWRSLATSKARKLMELKAIGSSSVGRDES